MMFTIFLSLWIFSISTHEILLPDSLAQECNGHVAKCPDSYAWKHANRYSPGALLTVISCARRKQRLAVLYVTCKWRNQYRHAGLTALRRAIRIRNLAKPVDTPRACSRQAAFLSILAIRSFDASTNASTSSISTLAREADSFI